jgi:hypothetical protein
MVNRDTVRGMTWKKGYPPECDACHGPFRWHDVLGIGIVVNAAAYELDACSALCLTKLAMRLPEDLQMRREFCEAVLRNYAQRHAFDDSLPVMVEAFIRQEAALSQPARPPEHRD